VILIVNEEMSQKTFNLAIRMGKLTADEMQKALQEFLKQQEAQKTVGEQSVKDLIGQGEGVTSVPVDKEGIRDFKKVANKYGVDFAVVKDKTGDPPMYTVFFKAKDADALAQVVKEYSAMRLNRENKPSILEELKKLKEMIASIPKKVAERKKEQTR